MSNNNVYTITGLIILVLFVSIPWFYNLYWMLNCLIKGGDWKYYAEKVLFGIVMVILYIGAALFAYGTSVQK